MARSARPWPWVVAAMGLVASAGLAACGEGSAPPRETFEWDLPAGFPVPRVPGDDPVTLEKIALGRRLFFDTRLSGNGTQACASCHKPELAFTDGRATALGSTGEDHRRASMGLANIAYANTLTWANPTVSELAEQALVPMFGEMPVELGLAGMEDALLERLRAVPEYQEGFPSAYPEDDDAFTIANLTRALATFERTLISGRSAYDRFVYDGEASALSEAAVRGRDLFFSERLECFHCHGGFNFSDAVDHEGKVFAEITFHNNALYNVDGAGGYPAGDQGLTEITEDPLDMGRFKAPSLRNIAVTAPYMHDGSIATLDEVLDHYAAGGRTVASGPNAGVGKNNPFKSEFMKGFELTEAEREDVIAFLESLTDDAFLENPAFADPW
jgi:cytochrome c peroxidase